MRDKVLEVLHRAVIGMMGASLAFVIQLSFQLALSSDMSQMALGVLVIGAVISLGSFLWEVPFFNMWWGTASYIAFALVVFTVFDLYIVNIAYEGNSNLLGFLTVLGFQMAIFGIVLAYSWYLENRRIAEINAYLQSHTFD